MTASTGARERNSVGYSSDDAASKYAENAISVDLSLPVQSIPDTYVTRDGAAVLDVGRQASPLQFLEHRSYDVSRKPPEARSTIDRSGHRSSSVRSPVGPIRP